MKLSNILINLGALVLLVFVILLSVSFYYRSRSYDMISIPEMFELYSLRAHRFYTISIVTLCGAFLSLILGYVSYRIERAYI